MLLVIISVITLGNIIKSDTSSGSSGDGATPSNYSGTLQTQNGMGLEYSIPPKISSPQIAAGVDATVLGDLWRYSTRLKEWRIMMDKEAFFKDALVGQDTHISDAVDGDTWTCNVVLPNGDVRFWWALRFYSSYNGKTNCFVSPYWAEPVCNTTSITVRWVTTATTDLVIAPTGTWTFNVYYKGSLLFSNSFELLPQIPPQTYPEECVPLHNQRAYSDPVKDIYDHIPLSTISQKGCALTNAVMVLGYHGFQTTPRELNEWLKNYKNPKDPQEVGYTKEGDMNFKVAVERYSGGQVKYAGITKTRWLWLIKKDLDPQLEKEIGLYGPQIARAEYAPDHSHFLTMTGRDKARTTWWFNDSVGGVPQMLNNSTLQWGKNTYDDIRSFVGPEYPLVDQWCRIWITFYSPGYLILTDSLGRREGYDPILNIDYFDEIPNSGYGKTGLMNADNPDEPQPGGQEMDIGRPANGEYELKVIGTETGNYDLVIDLTEREGGGTVKDFSQIPISPKEVHTYLFNYSREAGAKMDVSGGFDGKGQRPRDVNKFLSYSNPTQVTTELPAGEKSFNLLVFYDETIITGTFKAELNRQDITNLFSPSAGGNEIVKLNLASGRNTLILSSDGILSSGRKATDTDRLVFIVP